MAETNQVFRKEKKISGDKPEGRDERALFALAATGPVFAVTDIRVKESTEPSALSRQAGRPG